MTEQTHINDLEQGLNNLTRRPAIHSDSDLVRFAAGLEHVRRDQLSTGKRQDIWSTIISSSSTTSISSSRSSSPRRAPRSAGILPPVTPAPAVLFFGVMIALIVALTGIGNDGGDMVTPTAHAEQAATAIASPERPQPTSTMMMIEQDR